MPRSNREYIYGLPLSCILTVLNKDIEKRTCKIFLYAPNIEYNKSRLYRHPTNYLASSTDRIIVSIQIIFMMVILEIK